MKMLSREQMKQVMGGVVDVGGPDSCPIGSCDYEWTDHNGVKHTTKGTCKETKGECYCSNGVGRCNRIFD